jgi:5'-nucleotidase
MDSIACQQASFAASRRIPMTPNCISSRSVLLASFLLAFATAPTLDAQSRPRLLLTNDNGISDRGLTALAEVLARSHDVFVVASDRDRSGAASAITAVQRGELRAVPQTLRAPDGRPIPAWAVDGTPGDCVLLGLSGLLDPLPELVVSGINGGANLADEWIASGTIGAARVAAYIGLPAVAVSGLDDDDPAALAAATEWVARLVEARIPHLLPRGTYLTVSLPERVEAGGGVEVVARARGAATLAFTVSPDDPELWHAAFRPNAPAPGTDVAAWAAGKVAVVPMRVGEDVPDPAAVLRGVELPAWPPPTAETRDDGRR